MVTVLDLIKHVSIPVGAWKAACAYMLSRKDSPIAYTSLSFPLTESDVTPVPIRAVSYTHLRAHET